MVGQNFNASKKQPLFFCCIVPIALKFENDGPLQIYDFLRLADAILDSASWLSDGALIFPQASL